MGTDNWIDTNGDWANPGDWSTGTVPAGDDVTVAAGDPQITSDVGTVNSLNVGTGPSAGGAIVNLDNFGSKLAVTGNVTVGDKSGIDFNGAGTLNAGGTLTDTGQVIVQGGSLSAQSIDVHSVTTNARLTLEGATTTGAVTVRNAALSVLAGASTADAVTVQSGVISLAVNATLNSGSLSLATGTGFTSFDVALSNPTTGAITQDSVTGTVSLGGATLNVNTNAAGTLKPGESFTIIKNNGGSPVSGTFAGLPEGAIVGGSPGFTISYTGGTDGRDVVLTVVCFASGTLIGTMRGDVAVEELQPGDEVVTASGVIRPVVCIGHRVVDCAALPVPSESWPVRIRAGAFGDGLPKRDLYLSPGHPVLVGQGSDGVLVPIMCLINGTSIARIPVDTVTYWHVELDEHDILLAEGLPAESFLDYGNRPWFENTADHALTNPDFIVPGLGGRCRPVAVDGPIVEIERRRLDLQFQADLTAQCTWPTASVPFWF